MKRLAMLGLLIFVGFAGWRAGGVLSTDAMSMAVGMIFGVLAGLPVALLMLAASRRGGGETVPATGPDTRRQQEPQMHQPPVIVLAPPAYPSVAQMGNGQNAQLSANGYAGWPQQNHRPERSFTIVGETAEYVDDF